ncbi:MAG: proteasome subunit alpha, partial [Acidimicrobiales bacterium]
ARTLANQYAQSLGQVFTHEMKPMEVEILVAEIGHDEGEPDQMFHILYDGTVNDEADFAVLGGDAEVIHGRFEEDYSPTMSLEDGIRAATAALAGPDRTLTPDDLEVAELARRNGRRAFRRVEGAELEAILG